MAAENIDNTVGGTGLFNAKIPGLSDAADIQAALRLYHYGSYAYDGANTNTANLLTPSIAKHLQNLVDADALEVVNRTAADAAEVVARNAAITAHNAATTNVHGILNTADLATKAYVDGVIPPTVDQSSLVSPKELTTISATAATGAIDIDVVTSSIDIRTSNAAANWTINIRGNATTTLNSLMSTGQQISVVFESPQSGTAYYPTALTVDGASVTPKWLGGIAPSSGNINSTDVYVYTIRKTGSATFTALASQNKFA